MENWFRSFFLKSLLISCCIISPSAFSADEEIMDDDALIQPEVDRLEFNEAKIDGGDIEIQYFAGYMSIEDFGVSPLQGVRVGFHITEYIFTQLTLGNATGSDTSYEVIAQGAPLLTDEQRELEYYSLNFGYNMLPGEAFLTENTVFNTSLYLSVGIGATEFAGRKRSTYNYAMGYKFLLNDSFSIATEFRNNIFEMDVFGIIRDTNNLEFTLAIGWFF